jgi:hypothetical protein
MHVSEESVLNLKSLNIVRIKNAKTPTYPADILYIYNNTGLKIKTATFICTVTQDYFVLAFNEHIIWFIKKSEVKLFDKSFKSIFDYEVPIKRMMIETMFDRANTVERGIKITCVSKSDINIVNNALSSKTTFSNEAMVKKVWRQT